MSIIDDQESRQHHRLLHPNAFLAELSRSIQANEPTSGKNVVENSHISMINSHMGGTASAPQCRMRIATCNQVGGSSDRSPCTTETPPEARKFRRTRKFRCGKTSISSPNDALWLLFSKPCGPQNAFPTGNGFSCEQVFLWATMKHSWCTADASTAGLLRSTFHRTRDRSTSSRTGSKGWCFLRCSWRCGWLYASACVRGVCLGTLESSSPERARWDPQYTVLFL